MSHQRIFKPGRVLHCDFDRSVGSVGNVLDLVTLKFKS